MNEFAFPVTEITLVEDVATQLSNTYEYREIFAEMERKHPGEFPWDKELF